MSTPSPEPPTSKGKDPEPHITPPRPPTSNPTSFEVKSTPMSKSTHTAPVYSDTNKMLTERTQRKQDRMLELILHEIGDAVFQSKGLMDQICPADKDIVELVLKDLKVQEFASDQGLNEKKWPQGGPERAYYKPFADLLNGIVKASELHFSKKSATPEDRYYHGLRFYKYDTEMTGGTTNALKPDIVGLNGVSNDSELKRRVSWQELAIACELKDDWKELVKQAGTYARCTFVAHENRYFVPVIAFNQTTSEVRFCFYQRSGMVCSPALKLKTEDGFTAFVKGMVGVLSWKDASQAGIDPSRTNLYFRIPNWGLYKVVALLCRRQSIRGRVTHVYSLVWVDERELSSDALRASNIIDLPNIETPAARCHAPILHLHSRTEAVASPSNPNPTSNTSHLGKRSRGDVNETGSSKRHRAGSDLPAARSKQDEDLEKLDWQTIDRNEDSSTLPTYHPAPIDELKNIPRPDSIVLKDSWALDGRDEAKVFLNTQGKMGIPSAYAQYTVQHGTEEALKVEATGSMFPLDDLESWDLFSLPKDKQSEEPGSRAEKRTRSRQSERKRHDWKIEQRTHRRLILKTQCSKLQTAVGPYHFLQGVFHGMMGHYNMYMDGWLHRDVSDGNILLLPKPEQREPITEFSFTRKLTDCVGIISDGDQAIEWRQLDRELETHRSGTLPYMSMRLTNAWAHGELGFHTVVDDLESFFWVILCVLLSIGNERSKLKPEEKRWLGRLMTLDDAETMKDSKGWILVTLEDSLQIMDLSPVLKAFAPFLKAVVPVMRESALAVKGMMMSELDPSTLVESLTALGSKYYEFYFKVFLDVLPSLPKTWDEVFTDPI